MTDRRGRSPSVQLNEPASQLEGFLGSRGHPVVIGRIVMLIHPRAQLRSCTRPTVHIFTSVRQILNLLNASPASITTAGYAELERLIIRDPASTKGPAHPESRPPAGPGPAGRLLAASAALVTSTASPARMRTWQPADIADVTGPGTAITGRPSSLARRAVTIVPLRRAASTTRVPRASAAMTRLRARNR